MPHPEISASILNANFSKLGEEIRAIQSAGIHHIHFDVMDHHYVPNLSFGTVVCSSLRGDGIDLPIDVHLMVTNPENYIEPFANAGAQLITFHPDTVSDVIGLVDLIHGHGMQAGLAFNPDQEVVIETETLAKLEMILIMSVFPGFGGQKFIEETYRKIVETRNFLDANQSKARLAVDGGVNQHNIDKIRRCGADFFIVGSALFSAPDYQNRVTELTRQVG